MHAVLIGNYGVGNFGDEALKEYFLTAFPDIEWSVVSARPGVGELRRLPLGVRSFFGGGWGKTLVAIRQADAVVFGGGTLFTDVESVKACALWGLHASVARLLGTPVILAFQGVGPFRTRLGAWIARRVIRAAEHVSVRDPASAARVRAWRPDAVETFDPVFLSFSRAAKPRRPDGTSLLVPRHNSGEAFFRAADDLPAGEQVAIALFQPDDARECRVADDLLRRFPHASTIVIRDVGVLMDALSTAERCVCERFHGALAAAAAGAPTTVVSRAPGDKLDEARNLFVPGAADAARASAEKGRASLREALGKLC